MDCPKCEGPSKVVHTDRYDDGRLRWRKCLSCGYRYQTREVLVGGEADLEVRLLRAWSVLDRIYGVLQEHERAEKRAFKPAEKCAK